MLIKQKYPPKIDQHSIECAIFSAMPEELDLLKKKLTTFKCTTVNIGRFKFEIFDYHQKSILLASTGIGTTFAASVLTFIHQKFSPRYVFLLGSSGGIRREVKVHDVVIVEKAYEAEIQSVFDAVKGTPFETCLKHPLNNHSIPSFYLADPQLLKIASSMVNANIHLGAAVSSNSFPAPLEFFSRIKENNPCAIDMESSAFYQVAWLLKFKVLAIRGISNILNAEGKDDCLHQSDIPGSMAAATDVLWKIVTSAQLSAIGSPKN